MIRISAICLIIALIVPTFIRALIVGDYVLDYHRYVTELCVNKDKPPMHCDGKCAMMKNFQKADSETSDKPVIPTLKIETFSALFYQESERLIFIPGNSIEIFSGVANAEVLAGNQASIFRPPIAA